MGGRPLRVRYATVARGDADRTWAATSRAAELLGWTARTGLDEGLAQQIAWHRERRCG